jgi:hypothetical protein
MKNIFVYINILVQENLMVEPVVAKTAVWNFAGRDSPLKTKTGVGVC